MVCERLSAIGFDVVGERDSRAGLAQIATDLTPIHGVLLDLHTPSLDGLAVLQEIRRRHLEIPLIMMSTAAELERLRIAITLAAGEYLVKPFDQDLFAVFPARSPTASFISARCYRAISRIRIEDWVA